MIVCQPQTFCSVLYLYNVSILSHHSVALAYMHHIGSAVIVSIVICYKGSGLTVAVKISGADNGHVSIRLIFNNDNFGLEHGIWLRRVESNHRPPGYEPGQIPLLTRRVNIYLL
jgi:hypothetical protein